MTNLTPNQLATYASNAGFTGDDIATAVAVAQAESSGNPGVVGDLLITPGGSIGLWQINLKAHPEYTAEELKDPQTNANAAYKVWKAAGERFTPWTTYNCCTYLRYYPAGTQQPSCSPHSYCGSLGQNPSSASSSSPSSTSSPSLTPAAYTGTTLTANGFVYGYQGPPFNWQGHFSTTQWNTFTAWVDARTGNLPAIQQFHQIRAAQLRKTSGVLEKFYSTLNDEALAPTFNKQPWKPGPQGHFNYPFRDDHLPSVTVGQIKDYMKEQFQRQDEGVWAMNQLRNLIEKTEDKAEKAYLALNPTQWTNETIPTLVTRINSYFGSPEYEAVLVMDQTNTYPAGITKPRFRTNQLDIPTQHEMEQNTLAPAGTGASIDTKEVAG